MESHQRGPGGPSDAGTRLNTRFARLWTSAIDVTALQAFSVDGRKMDAPAASLRVTASSFRGRAPSRSGQGGSSRPSLPTRLAKSVRGPWVLLRPGSLSDDPVLLELTTVRNSGTLTGVLPEERDWERVATIGIVCGLLAVVGVIAGVVLVSLSDNNMTSLGEWVDANGSDIWRAVAGAAAAAATFLFGHRRGRTMGRSDAEIANADAARGMGSGDEAAAVIEAKAHKRARSRA